MLLLNIVASLCRTLITVCLTLLATSVTALAISFTVGVVENIHVGKTIHTCTETILITLTLLLILWATSKKLGEYGISEYLEAVYVVVLTWLMAPFICAVPFILSGMDFLDSLFEAISGLTGTGLTVISKDLLNDIFIKLWRSVLQWFGEIGIIVVTIAILAKPGSPVTYLYVAEAREEKISVTVWRTVKIMIRIYLAYTIVCTLAYIAAGVNLLDAICLAMTTIATGGFTPYPHSFQDVKQHVITWPLVYTTAIIMMIFGALNFRDHVKLFTRRFREFLQSIEVQAFLTVATIGILLTVLAYMFSEKYDPARAFEVGVFHAISALTTTGFQLEPISTLSDCVKFVLILLMIIGGCTCSTAGGIKIFRLIVLAHSIIWTIQESVRPRGTLIRRVVGTHRFEHADIVKILQFTILYLLVLIVTTLVLTASGYGLVDALFEATSALSCAGLSSGITGPDMPPQCKIALMIAMLVGRLEIMPWLLSIGYIADRASRKGKVLLSKLTHSHA